MSDSTNFSVSPYRERKIQIGSFTWQENLKKIEKHEKNIKQNLRRKPKKFTEILGT